MTNETFTLARTSPITGNINQLEIPLSIEAYALGMQAWKRGELIQNAFPTLAADIREFIMSGITPKEWDEMFADEEDF